MGNLMWKPFDDRFMAILERLRSYRDLIRLELSLSIARTGKDAHQLAEAEHNLAREERKQAQEARLRANESANTTVEMGDILCQQRKGKFYRGIMAID